jgi:hypothetical protein
VSRGACFDNPSACFGRGDSWFTGVEEPSACHASNGNVNVNSVKNWARQSSEVSAPTIRRARALGRRVTGVAARARVRREHKLQVSGELGDLSCAMDCDDPRFEWLPQRVENRG